MVEELREQINPEIFFQPDAKPSMRNERLRVFGKRKGAPRSDFAGKFLADWTRCFPRLVLGR